jgi:threonine dehydratase
MHNTALPFTFQLGCTGIDWAALKQALNDDDFDNGRSPEQLRISCENSAVNVFALLEGRVIGTLRVLSDGVGNAYMVDVWTHSTVRKRGIATHMVELALAQLPGQHVYLFTDDAQPFYFKQGFRPQGTGMSLVVGRWLTSSSLQTAAEPAVDGQKRLFDLLPFVPDTNAQAAVQAAERIRPYIRVTPLDHSLYLSRLTGADVHLKLENLQYTGSFKLRGAMNKLLSLSPEQRSRGVIAASSGNHGAAVAFGCRALGVAGAVYVPQHTSSTKLEAMRRYGIEIRLHGEDSLVSEQEARSSAVQQGLAYLSPYNDLDIVAGQGTVGVEIAEQLPGVEVVFVAVGGGGLIGGIASVLKAHNPTVRIVGCLPQNSPVMAASVERGQIVDMPTLPTLSDGTAGGIEQGAVTFPICQALVDEYVLVSEEEIAEAMRGVMENQHLLVEGAAAVAVAGLIKTAERWQGKQAAVVLCGGNVSLDTLRSVLSAE